MASDSEIIERIKAQGIDYERLNKCLSTHEMWGQLVNSFEYLTVLGIVCDAMRKDANDGE